MNCFAHPVVSGHPDRVIGAACTTSFSRGLDIHSRYGPHTRAVTVFCDTLTELTGHMKLRRRTEANGADDTHIFIAVQNFDPHVKYVAFAAFSALEDGLVAMGSLLLRDKEGILK